MKLNHFHFNSLNSTNTWAKEHVEEFEKEALTLITASGQTGGRGRFKRKWHSPPEANIYATYCLFTNESIGHIPQLLSLCAVEVLENLAFRPNLKWPNDILLNKKKMAGILCESVMVTDHRCVICGIGLNVNMTLDDLDKINLPATSLFAETGKHYSVAGILNELTQKFLDSLGIFLKKGFNPFFDKYQEKSIFKRNDKVAFHDNQHIIEGFFHAVNPDGSMTLKLKDGTLKTYYAGEFISSGISTRFG